MNKFIYNYKIGQKVIVPVVEYDGHSNNKNKMVLHGTIIKIDGVYLYIKIKDHPKYDILELYETEFSLEN